MKTAVREVYIPALPTFSPMSLLNARQAPEFLPFSSPTALYFYFARNGIYHSARALGLSGREVLVPAYHHGVEIEALCEAGAIPRFYGLSGKWKVDLKSVEAGINRNTRALYLTHYAGFPGPVHAFRKLADAHGLILFEDCALSLLSSDEEGPLGRLGDVSIFCLYKTLPVPNGGAIVMRGGGQSALPRTTPPVLSSSTAHLASSFLQHAQMRGGRTGKWVRNEIRSLRPRALATSHVATGTRHFDVSKADLGMSRITPFLVERMELSRIVERRRRNYLFLASRLRKTGILFLPELPPGVCPLFLPIQVPDKARVMQGLAAYGVEAVDFWSDFHPACDGSRFPEVRRWREQILEIPCHQDLEEPELSHLAELLSEGKGHIDA